MQSKRFYYIIVINETSATNGIIMAKNESGNVSASALDSGEVVLVRHCLVWRNAKSVAETMLQVVHTNGNADFFIARNGDIIGARDVFMQRQQPNFGVMRFTETQ